MAINTERPLPGGPLAIDLLNTTWQSKEGPVDWLEHDGAAQAFASEYGHSAEAVDVSLLRSALVQSRELTRRMFASNATSEDWMVEVNATLEAARATAVLVEGVETLTITGDQPHNALAIEALVNAIELRRDSARRVRCCEHKSCVLWFLDTSKGGRRRWCSMERCGNRSKAQRHYQRQTKNP